jgi:imidazolonepropionase-like amidohydrolase
MERIEADVLIPGAGEPVRNACVVLNGRTIEYAGPIEGAPPVPADARTFRVPAVMPGMWEAHGHFMGLRVANIEDVVRTPVAAMAARAVKDIEKALLAGFTSVREVGGLGVRLAAVVNEGTVSGPHIYGAGAGISQTGGHGDLHAFPLDVVHSLGQAIGYLRLADGVPECLKAVREQLRAGAKVIKVLASGGVMSELDHPAHQQFSGEELRAIVEEAGRAERVVAAHCHGKAGILAALRAGCATIEHGTYLDNEAADLMLDRKAILVPTRFILEQLVAYAKEASVPDYALQKAKVVAQDHAKALHLAIRKGVRIAVGTDIFMSGEATPIRWGMNGRELAHLVDAGMSPLKAIEAATANGPATLGALAPRSGVLRAGYDADVIAVSKDPLADIRVLSDPTNVTHVWVSGRLAKWPA